MITRISDDRYLIETDDEEEYGMGVFIDIYPFDGLGDNKSEAVRFGKMGDRLSSFCFQATRKHIDFKIRTEKQPKGSSAFNSSCMVCIRGYRQGFLPENACITGISERF